jgi:hypothetical protein
MTQPEFMAWIEFYKLNPFDDYHRFHRPAAMIAHKQSGTPMDELLEWLERRKPASAALSDADMTTMQAFGLGKRKT